MNKNNKTASLRILTMAALITLTGVGCKNAASDVLQLVPTTGKQEQAPVVAPAQVEFKVWKELIGNYRLTQFNGQAVTTSKYDSIKESMSSFYDRNAGKYLDSVIFPLYASVSAGSDMSYNFGPMESKGTTTLTDGEGVKVYAYKYDGPATLQGVDIEEHLEMNVIHEGINLYVTYTLTVPGHINTITRNFTLQKN